MTKITPILSSPIRGFNRNMLLELRAIVADSYSQAAEECYQMHNTPSARDLLPHKRKALVDDKVYAFAERHGIHSKYSKNKIKNCSHIELYCRHEVFVIYYTPSKSERPQTRFRNELAASCFLALPGLEQFAIRPGREFIEILHGPDGKNVNELGFIQFVKPSPYATGDIWKYNIDELLSSDQVGTVEVPDDAPLKLRRRLKHIKEK